VSNTERCRNGEVVDALIELWKSDDSPKNWRTQDVFNDQ